MGSAPPPITVAPKPIGAQDVGFSVKSALSTYTRMLRTWMTMPLMMCGIWFALPLPTVTAAVSGLMNSGRWTTTVPRSNGPTFAAVTDTIENGAP